jgi:hypothetical protein
MMVWHPLKTFIQPLDLAAASKNSPKMGGGMLVCEHAIFHLTAQQAREVREGTVEIEGHRVSLFC